jgi:hypothetical protein
MQVKERMEEMRLVLKAQADCNAKTKDEVFLFLKQKERKKKCISYGRCSRQRQT